MMNVTLPDGRVVRNVPDGTTKAQLVGKLINARLLDTETANQMLAQPQQAEEGLGQRLLIGLGSGFTRAGEAAKQLGLEAGEAVGLVDEGSADEFTAQATARQDEFRQTPVGSSVAGRVGEFVGEIAPSVALGAGVAGAASKLIPGAARLAQGSGAGARVARTLTNVGGGAAGGATAFREEGGSRATNATIGGAAAGVLTPLIAPVGRLFSRATRRAKKALTAGQRFKAARQALNQSLDSADAPNLSPEDIDRIAADVADGLTPEQAIRKFDIESVGATPTRGRVTGSRSDLSDEFQLLGSENELSQARRASQQGFSDTLDDRVREVAGDAPTESLAAGESAKRSLEQGRQALRNVESAAFDEADEALTRLGDATVSPARLTSVLDDEADFLVTDSLRPVAQRLRRIGLLDSNDQIVEGVTLTAKQAQAARRVIGGLFNSNDANTRRVAGRLQRALDTDVVDSVGEDVFAEARGVSSERFGRFDNRKLVGDLLDGKIAPERLSARLTSNATSVDDTVKFFETLSGTSPRAAAQVRGSVMEDIFSSARAATEDVAGTRAITPGQFTRKIERIGDDKLNAIFGAERARDVKQLAAVARRLFGQEVRDSGTPRGLIRRMGEIVDRLADFIPGGRWVMAIGRMARNADLDRQTERQVRRALNLSLLKDEQALGELAVSPSTLSAPVGTAAAETSQ